MSSAPGTRYVTDPNSIGFHVSLQVVPHNLVYTLCKILDIVGVQPRHRYPPVVRKIYVEFLYQYLRLLSIQPSEAVRRSHESCHSYLSRLSPKHPNLFHNMLPISRRLEFLRQQLVQPSPHGNNAVCHRFDISIPFLK